MAGFDTAASGNTASAAGGSPGPGVAPRQPSPAERARTLASGSCASASAVLTVAGCPEVVPLAHACDAAGRVLVLLPEDVPVCGVVTSAPHGDVPAVLQLVDVAPVAVPRRIRAQVWIGGWLAPVPGVEQVEAALAVAAHAELDIGRSASVLRLRLGEALLEDPFGKYPIEPEEFRAARPDPLAAVEAELLSHLDACHRGELAELARCVGGRAREHAASARPVALDAHGLRLRFQPTTGPCFDVRLPFPRPVREPAQLRAAFRALHQALHSRHRASA